VAQKFYRTHEDAYDYLAIFNNMDIAAGSSAVALEVTVRSRVTGNGDEPADRGHEFGSASRLQAVLNLGPLSQYPKDPYATVPARRAAGDTPLSIIAHETGHLFLAFASARVPGDPVARPMLGAQAAHWSFLFNSEASLLEGERIVDRGAGVSPRFVTTDTVQGYSPLDQYLMGFRAPADTPPTFYVTGPPAFLANSHPQRNFSFDGQRVDVTVDDVIGGEGRRTPDHTVAQRRFRFAFIVMTQAGAEPTAAELAQVERYRSEFAAYYARAAGNRAEADPTLRRSLRLSLFPATGVVEGESITGTVTVATAPSTPMPVVFDTAGGCAKLPVGVTIPAGEKSRSFTVEGMRPCVEEMIAEPRDPAYETVRARVQVSPRSALRLEAVSGDRQTGVSGASLAEPVVVRVTDVNRLPYPGVRLQATASGGALSAASAVTDAAGQASFGWTLGTAPVNQLRIAIEGGASLTVSAGTAAAVVTGVFNGASLAPGLTPGAFGLATGVHLTAGSTASAPAPWPDALAGAQVLLDGRALPVLAAGDGQIDFYVPADVAPGPASLTVRTASVVTAAFAVTVRDVMPGVFFDRSSGAGAVVRPGSTATALAQPVKVWDRCGPREG
jgi:hypothetical protein